MSLLGFDDPKKRAANPLVHEKLMPVLGVVRASSVRHAIDVAVLGHRARRAGPNIKTVSRRRTPPQWFRVPSDTYFNEGAPDKLGELGCETVAVITDAPTEERGVIEALRTKLRTKHVQVFSEVTPEPDEATIRRGVGLLQRVQPDLLIAIGGSSALDAGKAIRLFYEHPEKRLDELTMPFLDPRKRVLPHGPSSHPIGVLPNDIGH